jgi:NAD(P)H dehydrogenase (quinone)
MVSVSVVYHTGKGHTGVIAEAVARGAQSVEGVQVNLLQILPEQLTNGGWDDPAIMKILDASDAIIFGCPTWMGSVSSIFKAFMEATFKLWFEQRWKDKIAAGFTNSASQSGDKLSSLIQLAVFAAQLSMIWVGGGDPPGNNWSGGSVNDINRLGSWLGLMSQSNGDQDPDLTPLAGDRKTAERFGRRVAQITKRWNGVGAYTTEYIRESIPTDPVE